MLNILQSEKQLLVEKTEHMHSEIKAMLKSHAEDVVSAISMLTKEVKGLRRIACSCKCANKNVKSASKQLSPKSAVNLPSTASSPSLQINPFPAVEEGNKSNQLLQTAQPIEQRNSNKVSCSATVVDSAAAVTASYADVAKSISHPEQNASAADASASAATSANSASAHSNKPKVKALTRRIAVGSSSNDELNIAHRMKWLHLSSFKPSVTANNIIAYVSKHSSISSEMISCYSLVKKDVAVDSLKRVNFKLGVFSNHYDSLLNSELWPAGVKVRPFKFFQERVNKEVTT
ncbi:uncharacterized protein LOC128870270 [Anastrepha ludens]|uniref:uncharacterized protein LOC128870270 n=1 Tax=Anastrepha ludens TaxID=28586 RepID=UPI0023AF56DE|nr:uncharacterized protein LOC128870270 [Anastrepha ludens]